MELEQEVFGLVALLVDQVLMEESDEMRLVEEADGMEKLLKLLDMGLSLGIQLLIQ